MINIGVVTSSIPNTGIQLPFFSYGGTSLLILLSAVRSLAEYFKTGKRNISKNKEEAVDESYYCMCRNRWTY